jgi:hypothetical protein
MKITAFILLIFLSVRLSAQPEERALIKKTIDLYFDGWMTGDTTKVGKVMHSTCHLKFIRDNAIVVIDRNSYLSRFKLRPKSDSTFGRILSIDITGNIASAKCEIETPERLFTDYFNMMKLNDEWVIVDKISTSVQKPK